MDMIEIEEKREIFCGWMRVLKKKNFRKIIKEKMRNCLAVTFYGKN